ncbi:uncharacterized protein LOC132639456 [Lycium barbarum]|uniref:uncharacterized protein LOC132639456 n=1 Tax=Lycium barbarum TaxID=112863 RepID=UPI00293F68F0|nr:uncharacterized protein LOC132639456 [Lycium barbarum]
MAEKSRYLKGKHTVSSPESCRSRSSLSSDGDFKGFRWFFVIRSGLSSFFFIFGVLLIDEFPPICSLVMFFWCFFGKVKAVTSFGSERSLGFVLIDASSVSNSFFIFIMPESIYSPLNSDNVTSNVGTTTASTSLPFDPNDYTHPCHPLYIHPSDILGSSLVTDRFDGTSCGSWRRSILIALSVRNKIDFVLGNFEKPPRDSPLLRQWQRCNDLVVVWLANSVTKDIHRRVVYSELAQGIWKELEDRYGKADGARVFELNKDLAHISQGALDISSYFSKFKQLWNELASISVSSANRCTCSGGAKGEDEQRVYQFLMGLNETYMQRQVSAASQFTSESASFHAGSSRQQFNHPPKQMQFQHTFRQPPHSSSFRQQYNPKVDIDSLLCKYYKRTGHLMEKCHRLHGYPPSFKFGKNSGGTKKTNANAVFYSSDESGTSPKHGHNFESLGLSKEKHSQLLQVLKNTHIHPDASQSLMDSAHFADHMASQLSLLFDIKSLSIPCLVSLPNGYKVKVTNTGPSLRKPLVIGRLDNGLYKLHIPVAGAPSLNYVSSFFNSSTVSTSLIPATDSVSAISNDDSHCKSATVSINKMDVVWHYRLGHMPFSRMKDISVINSSHSPKQSFPCSTCPLARQTRLPFPDSVTHSSLPFQLVHIDTWGPYHSPTSTGARYFLTIVDDYARATWTHLMGANSNAFDLVKAFIAMVSTQFHSTVQTIRSDNALELGSSISGSKFFSAMGIIHQMSCSHTPQQNGIASDPPIFPAIAPVFDPPVPSLSSARHPPVPPTSSPLVSPPPPSVPDVNPDPTPASFVPAPPPLKTSSRPQTRPAYLDDFICNLPSIPACPRSVFSMTATFDQPIF